MNADQLREVIVTALQASTAATETAAQATATAGTALYAARMRVVEASTTPCPGLVPVACPTCDHSCLAAEATAREQYQAASDAAAAASNAYNALSRATHAILDMLAAMLRAPALVGGHDHACPVSRSLSSPADRHLLQVADDFVKGGDGHLVLVPVFARPILRKGAPIRVKFLYDIETLPRGVRDIVHPPIPTDCFADVPANDPLAGSTSVRWLAPFARAGARSGPGYGVSAQIRKVIVLQAWALMDASAAARRE